MIERKQKGDRLAALEVNDLSDRLRAMETPSGGKGVRIRSVPGSGVTVLGDSAWRLPKEAALECLAVNVGGQDLPAFCPAGVAGHYFEDPEKLAYKRALSVRLPEDGDEGRFVVTAEPIPQGRAGRVWVHGVMPVRVFNDAPESLVRADIEPGQTHLLGNAQGAVQILFEEDATGVHLAIARFTGPASSVTERVQAADLSGTIVKSGTQVIDGTSVGPGKRALLKDGVWEAAAGAWTFQGTPDLVIVLFGTTRGETAFFKLNDTPTYKGLGSYLK